MITLTLPEFVVGSFLRFLIKPVLGPPFPIGVQRLWLEVSGVLSRPPSGTTCSRTRLGGVPTVAVTTADHDPGQVDIVVLYLHGGAFVLGSHRTHQGLTGYLAKELGSRAVVYVVDYRLAPENPWPAGFDDALAAYRALVAKGISPTRIVVVGDSAGGVMTADLLLALAELGESPAGGVLLSPAVGIDMKRPDGIGPNDTLVTKEWAEQAMAGYARPTHDPSKRLLGRDLSGLPPIYLQFSRDELLADENRTFQRELESAGVQTEVHEDAGAFHVLALLPGLMKRARAALEDIAAFTTRVVEAADRRPGQDVISQDGAAAPKVTGNEVA
jgi:acetyl esterase/lipase